MLRDVRIRNSNRPSPVPFGFKSFTYVWYGVDSVDYITILAPDRIHADQFLRDYCFQNELDNVFFRFECETDFMICPY